MNAGMTKMAAMFIAASAAGPAAAQSMPGQPAAPPSTMNRPGQVLVNASSNRDPQARIARNIADAASPPHGPAAAASAVAEATARNNAKAEADADLAARLAGARPRLRISRENLTGDAAKATLLRQGLGPPNYDHSMAMGDKDHIEQVTSFRVYMQKPAVGQ